MFHAHHRLPERNAKYVERKLLWPRGKKVPRITNQLDKEFVRSCFFVISCLVHVFRATLKIAVSVHMLEGSEQVSTNFTR